MKLHIKKIIGSTLLCGIILMWIFLVKVYEIKNHKHYSLRYSLSTHRHRPVTVADIAYISPWMTFDYINNLFNIPQSYLKDSLHIDDSKYPFITLGQYSKKNNISTIVLIETIRSEIKKYLISSSIPQ